MTVEELENLPDGIVPQKRKSPEELAVEIYAQMYKITLDKMDAKDCAKLTARILGEETKDKMWNKIENKLNDL